MIPTIRRAALALLLAAGVAGPAHALDTLKLAIGQRGNWENAGPELGQTAGIFRKHGLDLELLYTQGGGETMQAVISGSVDIGIGVGTYAAMGAFAKGAPVRAIGNSTTGSDDTYWYVPANSPIRTIPDAAGRTVAYSSNGSSSNIVVLGFQRQFGIKLTPVATGNPASTLTQVMSGQVDVGWSSPPFGLPELKDGRIRILARGGVVKALDRQTLRVMISNATVLARRQDVVARFMQAYQETLDWMYSDPAALGAYADWVKIPLDVARTTRDEFYPPETLRTTRLEGVDDAMATAIDLKILPKPLTREQQGEFFRYPGGVK